MLKVRGNFLKKIIIKTGFICLVTITVVFLNNIIVKGVENKKELTNVNKDSLSLQDSHSFIIDAPVKCYNDIKKLKQVSDYKFKIPDFIPDGNRVVAFQLRKVSEKCNAIEMFFENSNGNFAFQAFQGDPVEVLKNIESDKTKTIENSKLEIQKEPLKIDGVTGLSITLTTTFPKRKIGDNNFEESQNISQYYVWEDDKVWYSLEYYSYSKSDKNINTSIKISQDTISKIVKSLKFPEEIKNVDYSIIKDLSSEVPILNIYDEADLEEAKSILKFNPKFPLKLEDDINITGSIVGVSNNNDSEKGITSYEINNFYSNKNGSITFTQRKASKLYDNIKNTGYTNDENNKVKQIKAEELYINNIQVFKFPQEEVVPQVNYLWKENDIYYELSLFVNIDNCDDIVKGFITSKPLP
ncbi:MULTISPECIES: hypothetical protein [unclassified Clostridium]|uniref:hypothetical protein n=1 Tax=unclassified Clostridium TaxID=2614128 RepID=UPI0002974AF5|nr:MULTISPECIES: hypothetical protein [unclassified Clostridium]EKQ58255.1 MAG: hypothetical protein A370_00112 [Clostridium sp. Maddingley MBC34-26]